MPCELCLGAVSGQRRDETRVETHLPNFCASVPTPRRTWTRQARTRSRTDTVGRSRRPFFSRNRFSCRSYGPPQRLI
eukprot:329928-Prymnesium_polylepis.1